MRARAVPPLFFCAAAWLIGGCRGGASGGEVAPPIPDVAPIDAHRQARPPPDVEPPALRPRSPAAQGQDDGAPFEGTVGEVEKARSPAAAPVLRDVRAGRHDGFDRVVFEFTGELPGYHVAYIDRPVRKCGSGDTTEVAGDGWLEVRMSPAHAHDEAGKPTSGRRERKEKLDVVKELELTCDFEAVVTWVIGVASPNRYRVLELSSPSRLVVDVRH